MPGMGIMRESTPEMMKMDGMGWMSMDECHHCSMPLLAGENAWRNASVSAQGWTMRVRCALCARDMSAETKGTSILRIPLESPDKTLMVFSDEEGNLTADTPGVLFLEEEGSHARCPQWSRAFSSLVAFEEWVKNNPKYSDAKPLIFNDWSQREGKKPDTYVKPRPPMVHEQTP
jgi:hypothetical protein